MRDFEQSGLNRKAFCSERGVALHTLDYYRARNRTRRVATAAQDLLPVDVIGAPSVSGGLRVELPMGGASLLKLVSMSLHLKRLVSVLEG